MRELLTLWEQTRRASRPRSRATTGILERFIAIVGNLPIKAITRDHTLHRARNTPSAPWQPIRQFFMCGLAWLRC